MNNSHGTSLSERLGHGPMPVPDALAAALVFADSLRRMHDSGVVHGALEPACVILHESGASLQHGAAVNHMNSYTAPEQAQGKTADARSDIFAFGAILYELLSGRRAFAGEGEELRVAILEREPAPLDGVPAGLARLVLRSLAKAPARRWQRMQNLQMELKLLDVIARREEGGGAEMQERRVQAMLRHEIAQMEERLGSRLSSIETRQLEESDRLESARQVAQELRVEIATLSARLDEADRERKTGAAAAVARFDELEHRLAEHGSAIESLGSAVSQSDDLIEHLVDEFDALQRGLAMPARAQAAAPALSI